MTQNLENRGFREFRVAKKHVESEIITSFYLEPSDGAPVWQVKAGQYITLTVPSAGDTVLKTYSVSSDPSQTSFYRISVKREAGQNGTPDGVGSCWLHDHVEIGDVIDVAAPRGTFYLDEESTRPVVLLSGGVGQTPMVSMIHRLCESDRDVYFLHACENGQVHALRDEVLGCSSDRITTKFVYRTPSADDRAAKLFDAQGVIDKVFLQRILPIDDYEVYLCGPTPFMAAMYQLLQEVGVQKARIAYEFFGKAASLDAQVAKPQAGKAASRAPAIVQSLTYLTNPDAWSSADEVAQQSSFALQGDVSFRKSKTSAAWDGAVDSLLELAESEGLNPEFSCRSGICNACKCTLVSGEVEYFQDPLIHPEEGQVLICCSRPKGAVVLDI
jgi:ferredoxin-NADP reductase/ferredoxin